LHAPLTVVLCIFHLTKCRQELKAFTVKGAAYLAAVLAANRHLPCTGLSNCDYGITTKFAILGPFR